MASAVISWYISSQFSKVHHDLRSNRFSEEIIRVILTFVLFTFIHTSFLFFLRTTINFRAAFLAVYICVSIPVLVLIKYVLRKYLHSTFYRGELLEKIILIGSTPAARDFYYTIKNHAYYGYKCIGFLDDEISENVQEEFESIIDKLILEQPIQYVLGVAHFYGLTFSVNPSVLIPRPETEELVDWIIKTAKNSPDLTPLLDIGTGSGCIAISLKANLPHAEMYALDTSSAALAVTAENAVLNATEVKLIHADIRNFKDEQRYGLIVSNPPYVRELEKDSMHAQVLAHEPHLALFVSNEDPLVFYKAIADFALINLLANGFLFFEINEYLGDETVSMLKDKGFTNVELRKDMQGKDRMIKAGRTC
ncbi:MAG: peptide chain release factor N(5)-glutamine methyltransferase [Pedobacter sp.]|nr:MAG: peptide chain release factor N(5)-glutamine methyltransferase [Pedobacter sp.]